MLVYDGDCGFCAAWWVDGTTRASGHGAIARALLAIGGAWRVPGRLLLVPPVS